MKSNNKVNNKYLGFLTILVTFAAYAPGNQEESPIAHQDESILNVDRRVSNTGEIYMGIDTRTLFSGRELPFFSAQEPEPTSMMGRAKRFTINYCNNFARFARENPRLLLVATGKTIALETLLLVSFHPALAAVALNSIAGAAITMAHSVAGQTVAAHAMHAVISPSTVSEVACGAYLTWFSMMIGRVIIKFVAGFVSGVLEGLSE